MHDTSLLRIQAFVDGEWTSGLECAPPLPVFNPIDNQPFAMVPNLGERDAVRAIQAANKALGPWRAKTGKERAAVLRRWFDLVIDNADDLAALMSAEQGRPLSEALGDGSDHGLG